MWRLVLLLAAFGCASPDRGGPVVSAAASLTDALTDVGRRYEAETGEVVALNFAGSNVLARQILAGAPVDLFISADEAQMDAVETETAPGTRGTLLSNQLVVAVPSDRARHMASAGDLLADDIRRIAVGEPAAVPAGVYARRYLESQGIWEALQPKLVPMGSVRLALAAVEQGAADAAVVFRTDVASSHGAIVAFAVPPNDGPAISYPAAVLRTGRHAEAARRFLAYLRGPNARAIFAEAGFILP
ncbi:MAG: molybdate ABC transporter substrate-binding protein [Vicinamibacterales bacterium]